jgi:acyl-coenzyme A thioesterase PaaI-like protein
VGLTDPRRFGVPADPAAGAGPAPEPGAFTEAIAARPAGSGRYEVMPDGRFAMAPSSPGVPAAINGGVLIATVLSAVLADSPHPHPVSTSVHFLRVPKLAPAHVQVDWLKQGKTTAVARAALIQDDVLLVDATVAAGTLPARTLPAAAPEPSDGAPSWTASPPAFPPVQDCIPLRANKGFAGQVDLRLDPATAGWLDGQPSGTPEIRGYFQLRDYRDPDAYLLALAVDVLPPAVFGLGAVAWAPTVELTWHMRAVPAPGQLRVAARARHVSDGWFDEEAEVWDSSGQLVAQSRQLARVGRPGR